MNKVKKFEDLWIWQQARELVKNIYKDFYSGPCSKDYGFRGQIQEAGVSIMNNIAEGFERRTDSEFARFLDIAKGSCGEVKRMSFAIGLCHSPIFPCSSPISLSIHHLNF